MIKKNNDNCVSGREKVNSKWKSLKFNFKYENTFLTVKYMTRKTFFKLNLTIVEKQEKIYKRFY